jgi:O-antigen ligase
MSYMYTGTYSSNMRMLELGFSAAAIFLLGSYRSYLATALAGIGLTAVAVGAGLSPYGHRLGMADIGDRSMGNPISLGLPAALVLLMGLAHGGRWLLAEARPVFRSVLMMAVAVCLLLSTSRGSWLVTVIGFLVIFASTRQRRLSILLSLVPLVIVGGLVLASGRGEYIRMYLGRAIDPGQSMAERTTGRSKQWVALPEILAGSPVWGHGPGAGMETNIRYTGIHKAFHSLYLQVAVELGGIGIVLLTMLLGSLVARGVRHRRMTGDAVPLMGITCFMTIVVSVSGIDAISGVFLGLGFLAQDFTGMYVMRETVLAPDPRLERAPAQVA